MAEKIVARGYHKFFNLNEREDTRIENLNNPFIFPLEAIEKANGYLGLLSAFTDKNGDSHFHISSKTNINGEYSEVFHNMIESYLDDDLKEMLLEKNVTLLFEVIEPEFDPHIEEYNEAQLVFLDAVRNIIDFELDYEAYKLFLSHFINKYMNDKNDKIVIRAPKKLAVLNNYQELTQFLNNLNTVKPFDKVNYIEGAVIKEKDKVSPFMFKLKTKYYKFWKYMRTIKDSVYKKIQEPALKDNKDINGLFKRYSPEIKARLYAYEENVVVNFMFDKILKDPNDPEWIDLSKINIIELRKKILKTLKEKN